MSDEFEKEIANEFVKQTAGKLYDDIAHPALEAAGNIVALPFQAIDAALSPIKFWIDKTNYDRTRKLLALKLENTNTEKIVPPEKYVAVPALQQLSYSFDSEDLCELYANLLASSMNVDTKYQVHPAYVDIIRQLSPDEAKIINNIYKTNPVVPIINVSVKMQDDAMLELAENYTCYFDKICCYPETIGFMLKNMERLGILNIRYDQRVIPETTYDILLNKENIIDLISTYENMPNSHIKIERGLIELSEFGKGFCKICCAD